MEDHFPREEEEELPPLLELDDDSVAVSAATFRPNLAGFTPTKIRLPDCDDESSYDDSHSSHDDDHDNRPNSKPPHVVQVNATNDFATTNYNERVFHWIDLHFLRENLGPRKTDLLLSDFLEEPPCATLGGTYSSSEGGCCNVLGTLYLPLSVSCKFDIEVTIMDPKAVGGSPSMTRDTSRRTFTTTDAVCNDDESIWQRQQELLHDDEEDSAEALRSSTTNTPEEQPQKSQSQQQPLRLPPGWVNLLLSNIVVVDHLPVPFHISFRAIQLMPSIVSLSTLSPRHLFSPHYQQHPFWAAVAPQLRELRQNQVDPWESEFALEQPHPETQLVGIPPPPPRRGASGKRRPRQQQERPRRLLTTMTTPVGIPLQTVPEIRKCACCFQSNPQVKCGGAGCKDVFYCDKICQSGHWKLHKKTCLNNPLLLSSSSLLSATSRTASSRGGGGAVNLKQEQPPSKTTKESSESSKKRWWKP